MSAIAASVITEPAAVRVLLVDDHPVVRSGLVLALSRADDLIVVGESGSRATARMHCARVTGFVRT